MARKNYTEAEVQKRIEALPEAAGDFLYSADMGALIKLICDKHKLHIDQMALLEAETGELMLGLTEPQEFVPNMMATLQIDNEKAQAIAKEINDQVMMKMRHLMGAPTPGPDPVVPTPSVVMPSSPKPVVAPASAPILAKPAAPAPLNVPPIMPKPTAAPNLMAAEAMLSEKKVTTSASATSIKPASVAPATPASNPVPKVDPVQPKDYKADPYREPVE